MPPVAAPNMSVTVTSLSFSSPLTSKILPSSSSSSSSISNQLRRNSKKKKASLICRADFSQDAPFAVAMGACLVNSVLFPLPNAPSPQDHDDDEDESAIDSTDARFAVMGIISFIPYFNWLSWIFAWLDTNRSRYVVYSIVYLAPYLRTNLSLSPEESWLPIASIFICIIHIQLEASIRNGDFQGFELFNEVLKHRKDAHLEGCQEVPHKGRKNERIKLPSQKRSRNDLQGWGLPKKSSDHQLKEDEDADGSGRS